MIAVADTSPIRYLILSGEIELPPKLFSQVPVPPAELLHEDAPAAVRSWGSNLPPWIGVNETPLLTTSGLEKLQAGEQAAILLAESVEAGIILLDEKAARRVAAGRGLRVTGIGGVLGEAATRGLVELAPARRWRGEGRSSADGRRAATVTLRPRGTVPGRAVTGARLWEMRRG